MSDDSKRGLYRKYAVERLHDPLGRHHACDCFVLDLVHDEFVRAALLAYARACRKKFPQLATDLRRRFSRSIWDRGAMI